MPSEHEDRLLHLVSVCSGLGEDELLILLLIARRLKLGQAQYGELHLAEDVRQWRREAGEELLDACVYLAAGLSTRRDGGKA